MQRQVQVFSKLHWSIELFLLGAAILITGCTPKEPEVATAKNTVAVPDEKREDKTVNAEEARLLQEQMAIYDKMTEHFEKATTYAQLKAEMPAISALGDKMKTLNESFNARPAEAKLAAQMACKKQWDETWARYQKAKNLKRQ